jgi:hypothetical protein
MCFLGISGIILIIINNEIMFATGHDEDTIINWFIKLTISISTVILIGLILYYHQLDLTRYSIRNSIEDWRIGLTMNKIFLIIIEILICSIHPVPRQFQLDISSDSIVTTNVPLSFSYISIDTAFGLSSKYNFFCLLFKINKFI